MAQVLNFRHVKATIARLQKRINERFGKSELSEVAQDLVGIAEKAESKAADLTRPYFLFRLINVLLLGGLAAFVWYSARNLRLELRLRDRDPLNIVQALDAMISTVVFVGAAIVFFVSMENRAKRKKAL